MVSFRCLIIFTQYSTDTPYRLDIIRAFATPQRLCFTQDLRERLLSLCDLRFESVNGCPRELVLIIGDVLNNAKNNLDGNSDPQECRRNLQMLLERLYAWDSSRSYYPEDNPLWLSVAESFRHACILRSKRLLNVEESADKPHIQESVNAVLDSVADIPDSSPLIELFVLPLFMAGADCVSRHSRHYILLRLSHIKARSEMVGGITAPQSLLEKVWHAREQQSKSDRDNVPWMQFVSFLLLSLSILFAYTTVDIQGRLQPSR